MEFLTDLLKDVVRDLDILFLKPKVLIGPALGSRVALLPLRSRGSSAAPSPVSFRLFGAGIAANLPVKEAEEGGHDVADVGQAEEHQGYAQNGVEDGDNLA